MKFGRIGKIWQVEVIPGLPLADGARVPPQGPRREGVRDAAGAPGQSKERDDGRQAGREGPSFPFGGVSLKAL